jgi:hypothetical protein
MCLAGGSTCNLDCDCCSGSCIIGKSGGICKNGDIHLADIDSCGVTCVSFRYCNICCPAGIPALYNVSGCYCGLASNQNTIVATSANNCIRSIVPILASFVFVLALIAVCQLVIIVKKRSPNEDERALMMH